MNQMLYSNLSENSTVTKTFFGAMPYILDVKIEKGVWHRYYILYRKVVFTFRTCLIKQTHFHTHTKLRIKLRIMFYNK